ncbi:hypothetical protein HK100_003629 [Physocladia obscura]|uniref:DSBA-like thioredoxin domain-containing protein n=1 Tax=Physocladia obscura TaxID=109957 RepID=A0AAD5T8B4_9FUNG|nr:hypothetical protein HK100_003629 [Physocladia obscura]
MVKVINVTITTDTICPWCYIGKKRFERAVAAFKELKGPENVAFKVNYQPFLLDPTLSKTGKNKLEHYKSKFGEARTAQMIPYMQQVGAKEGISFSYGGMLGNSLDSHRLVKYAGTLSHDAQDQVINALYRSYFEEEKNIGDVEVLVEAGRAGGVNEDVVRNEIFGGDLLLQETQVAVGNARESGINGVPHFVIEEKVQVSGAQDSDAFVQYFEQVFQEK